jgi:hypothetical protein
MLSPRLTDCPECANIPSLLKKIDCKLAELGNNLYNNISYMLNKPIPAGDILQLIAYRRILTHKYCNPNYVEKYSVQMIASRVIRLTVGCVSRCNEPERCLEDPCDITIVPNPSTTTTSSSSTTTSTSTIAPVTTTTSTTAAPSTTSTTTSGGPTTTTTSTTTNIVQKLEGLRIETIYLESPNDLAKLPPGYVHPCPLQISAHTCDRAFFEITGNDIYIGDSLLNNLGVSPQQGVLTQSGKYTCEDYNNTPAPLTGGIWTGHPDSRYSQMTITGQQAVDIANVSPGNCTIEFKLVPTMITYNSICDNVVDPHENVTWTRITKPNGTVIYNGCPIGNIITLNICV